MSLTHVLQPHHPSINDIDADELEAAIHIAINENLDSQADDLNNVAIGFEDSDDDDDLDEDSDDADDESDDELDSDEDDTE